MIIDIVILVLVAFAILIGLKNGLAKSVVSATGLVVTKMLVLLMAKPFSAFLAFVFPMDIWITAPLEGWVSGLSPLMGNTASYAELPAVLLSLNIPTFMVSFLEGFISPTLNGKVLDVSFASVVSSALTYVALLALSVFILYLVLRILLILPQKRIEKKLKLQTASEIRKSSRVLGCTVSLMKCYIFILTCLSFVAMIITFTSFSGVKTEVSDSVIAKTIYNNNFLANWYFGYEVKFEDNDVELNDSLNVEVGLDMLVLNTGEAILI